MSSKPVVSFCSGSSLFKLLVGQVRSQMSARYGAVWRQLPMATVLVSSRFLLSPSLSMTVKRCADRVSLIVEESLPAFSGDFRLFLECFEQETSHHGAVKTL